MSEIGSPLSGLSNDRKLRYKDLIHAIRFVIAAEYEAVQRYMQLAESTDNQLAINVFKNIADQERVHAFEFIKLLHELAPDQERFYNEGIAEVNQIIQELKK